MHSPQNKFTHNLLNHKFPYNISYRGPQRDRQQPPINRIPDTFRIHYFMWDAGKYKTYGRRRSMPYNEQKQAHAHIDAFLSRSQTNDNRECAYNRYTWSVSICACLFARSFCSSPSVLLLCDVGLHFVYIHIWFIKPPIHRIYGEYQR